MAKSLSKKTLTKEKPEPKEEKIFTCLLCKDTGRQAKFYKSRNDLMDEEFSICKKCTKSMLLEDSENDNIDNLLYIFRMLDYPFFKEMWEECMSEKDTFDSYIKKINSPTSKIFKMRYKDGLDVNVLGASFYDKESNLGRWGSGFNDAECKKMNRIVDDYIKLTGKEDFKSIKDFERVARLEVTVDRVYASPNSKPNEIKQAEETLTSIMKEAGLTSDKMSSASKADCFGSLVAMVETEEPIPETSPDFEDVDKIGYYFNRFILKPLLRTMGKDDSKVLDEFNEVRTELKEKEKKFGGK